MDKSGMDATVRTGEAGVGERVKIEGANAAATTRGCYGPYSFNLTRQDVSSVNGWTAYAECVARNIAPHPQTLPRTCKTNDCLSRGTSRDICVRGLDLAFSKLARRCSNFRVSLLGFSVPKSATIVPTRENNTSPAPKCVIVTPD